MAYADKFEYNMAINLLNNKEELSSYEQDVCNEVILSYTCNQRANSHIRVYHIHDIDERVANSCSPIVNKQGETE